MCHGPQSVDEKKLQATQAVEMEGLEAAGICYGISVPSCLQRVHDNEPHKKLHASDAR